YTNLDRSKHVPTTNGSMNRRLHKFLMKRGLGSPGHIARHLAKRYRLWKRNRPSMSEPKMIRYLFAERIGAQTLWGGGPEQYKYLKAHSDLIDELVAHHPDLFSIVLLSIFIEHPELLWPDAPPDTFEFLQATVEEILDAEVPGWRTQGIWSSANIVCSLCR